MEVLRYRDGGLEAVDLGS